MRREFINQLLALLPDSRAITLLKQIVGLLRTFPDDIKNSLFFEFARMMAMRIQQLLIESHLLGTSTLKTKPPKPRSAIKDHLFNEEEKTDSKKLGKKKTQKKERKTKEKKNEKNIRYLGRPSEKRIKKCINNEKKKSKNLWVFFANKNW